MKKVISASRRTDLVAFFPDWLADVLKKRCVKVNGPRGGQYSVDLDPSTVHSIVLWSKNFEPLLTNRHGLRDVLAGYDQIYCHFTITGLGGTVIEPSVPDPDAALSQLDRLLALLQNPRRLIVRFDPVIYWLEGGKEKSNLPFFKRLAPELSRRGIQDVCFSAAQWYAKSQRRANKAGFAFIDPPLSTKRNAASILVQTAQEWGLNLSACAQLFLADCPGIEPSACIDGRRLQTLHPRGEKASFARDRSQRSDCLCTKSTDIGSYTQPCPHPCLYCYAN